MALWIRLQVFVKFKSNFQNRFVTSVVLEKKLDCALSYVYPNYREAKFHSTDFVRHCERCFTKFFVFAEVENTSDSKTTKKRDKRLSGAEI